MLDHTPVAIPLSFFLAALVIPMLLRNGRRFAWEVALLAAGLSTGLAGWGLVWVLGEGTQHYKLGGWDPPMGIELVLDPLSAFLALVVTGVGLFVLIHSGPTVKTELPGKEAAFYSCAMLLMGGLLGMVLTGDLFNLYVFLEISSLASYALIAVGDKRAPFAAFRYLILGTVGASFYLLGLGFLFFATGSLNMADVAAILTKLPITPEIVVATLLIGLGIALKMALFPMHGWLPDAYTYASSSATALIAPIGTKVAAYVLIRFFFYLIHPELVRGHLPLTQIVGYLGAAGIVWGSVMAIAQTDLKRMLAYSSVGQVGYIALGIGLSSPLGLIGAVLHILNHAVMKACLFLVGANFLNRLGHATIPRLDNSLRMRMPWTTAAFALAALSMIGLPPTAGFFSKWYLVLGSVEQSRWLFIAVILLSSLLNAVYFFRVLEKIYLRKNNSSDEGIEDGAPEGHASSGESDASARLGDNEVSGSMLVPTLVLGVAVLALGGANAFIVNEVIEHMIPAGL